LIKQIRILSHSYKSLLNLLSNYKYFFYLGVGLGLGLGLGLELGLGLGVMIRVSVTTLVMQSIPHRIGIKALTILLSKSKLEQQSRVKVFINIRYLNLVKKSEDIIMVH
jgi:hypothetical protein